MNRARAWEASRKSKPTPLREMETRYLAWVKEHQPHSYPFREKALKHLVAAFGDAPLSAIARATVERPTERGCRAGTALLDSLSASVPRLEESA